MMSIIKRFETILIIATVIIVGAMCFVPRTVSPNRLRNQMVRISMKNIANNVQFDTIAREWRLKWSGEQDKSSLVDVQNKLTAITSKLSKIKGIKSVQRVVCGGCQDYKVITSLDADSFDDWVSLQACVLL